MRGTSLLAFCLYGLELSDLDTSSSELKLVIAMPRGGSHVVQGAARGYYCATSTSMNIVAKLEGGGSASNHNYNILLAMALDMRDHGDATHFAMIHADVDPQIVDWPEVLYQEMIANKGDFISSVIAIKDQSPNPRTSTAIRGLATEVELWGPRRYIMVKDHPTKVPDGFSLGVVEAHEGMPDAGQELVCIARQAGSDNWENLKIRFFDAAGRIVVDIGETSFKGTHEDRKILRNLLARLKPGDQIDKALRDSLVTSAATLAGYEPLWTFGPEHVCKSDEVLLLNNGLCMFDLRHDWWDECIYTCLNRVDKDPETGAYIARFRSEDWEVSHFLQKKGARVLGTWKVPIVHHGETAWPNY